MISGTSVTVAICSYGRPRLLADVTRNVLSGNELPDCLLIIEQTDQPSPTMSSILAEYSIVQYVASAVPSLSGKRNLAIQLCTTDVLVFTDDDVSIPPEWLGKLVRELVQAGRGTVVTGRVLAGPPEGRDSFAPSLHPAANPRTYTRRSTLSDPLATFNLAAYRELLLEIGDFDERLGPGTPFPSCEDNDYGFRILEASACIRYAPGALLYHRAWRDVGELNDLRFRYGLGQGAFYAKHGPLGSWYIFAKLLAALGRHGKRLMTIKSVERRSQMHWFKGFLAGYRRWGNAVDRP